MGLFTEAGKKFEETKRALVGDDTPQYGCRACTTALDENYEYCPHCGEQAVVLVE
jgi:rubrerythrin